MSQLWRRYPPGASSLRAVYRGQGRGSAPESVGPAARSGRAGDGSVCGAFPSPGPRGAGGGPGATSPASLRAAVGPRRGPRGSGARVRPRGDRVVSAWGRPGAGPSDGVPVRATGVSQREIGQRLGGVDYSWVSRQRKALREALVHDPQLHAQFIRLQAALTHK